MSILLVFVAEPNANGMVPENAASPTDSLLNDIEYNPVVDPRCIILEMRIAFNKFMTDSFLLPAYKVQKKINLLVMAHAKTPGSEIENCFDEEVPFD